MPRIIEKSWPSLARTPSALRLVLASAGLVLGALAQLQIDEWSLRWSIGLFALAGAFLAVSAAGIALSPFAVGRRWPSPTNRRSMARSESVERLLGGVALASAAAMLVASLVQFAAGPPQTVAWYLYGAFAALMLIALPSLDGRWSALLRRVRAGPVIALDASTLLQMGVLALVLLIALLVRTYHLQDLPAGLWYDEANNLAHANQFQQRPDSIPVFIPSTNLPSLFLLPIAAVINLMGVTITAGRVVAVAFGLAGVASLFLLSRLTFGPVIGLVAAFLIAVTRWEINWSRIGMQGITLPLFAALTAYLTLRALRSHGYGDFGFAGAALGLGMWFYSPFSALPAGNSLHASALLHRRASSAQAVCRPGGGSSGRGRRRRVPAASVGRAGARRVLRAHPGHVGVLAPAIRRRHG